jgi:hypothetical protein
MLRNRCDKNVIVACSERGEVDQKAPARASGFGAIMNRDASRFAQKFIVGGFIGVLEPAPPAYIINHDQLVIGFASGYVLYPKRGFSRASSTSFVRNGSSVQRPVTIRRHRHCHQSAGSPLAEGILLLHLLDSCLQRYELQPFFRITDCSASLSRLRFATSFRSFVFSSRSCLASCAWLTSIPPYFAFHA